MTDTLTLKEFVIGSNAMEGIYKPEGDPLFDNHFTAARLIEECAQNGTIIMPLCIHDTVMPDEPGYRKRQACIIEWRTGKLLQELPPPQAIPGLMMTWRNKCSEWHSFVMGSEEKPSQCKGEYWHDWISDRAWYLHHWFLCIHPFDDGNGRTARLFLNSFRRACGLPWRLVNLENSPDYYTHIREFENKEFKESVSGHRWADIYKAPAA